MTANIIITVNGYQDGIPILLTPSSTLSGLVHLSLPEPKDANYLKVQLDVVSRSSVDYKDDGDTKTDREVRCLLDEEIRLINPGQGQVIQLLQGNHVFPFSFPMNGRNLPSSFNYKIDNYISWTLTAAADFKGQIFDNKGHMQLLVDFPRYILAPQYVQPMALDDEKNICCLCCADGPITLYASVSRTGAAPGSFIDLYVKCDNLSGRHVQLAWKLVRRTHMGRFHTDTNSWIITETLGPAVSPKQRGEEWRFTSQISTGMRPATIDHCDNFSVIYYFQAEARIPNALDLNLYFPMTIGTESIDQGIPPNPI